MLKPDIPVNEVDRLRKLRSFNILDTLSEEEYDQITYLSTILCNTPISALTFIDEDRQWFKSKIGLKDSQNPRAISFCAHAINEESGFLEIPNANDDVRFKDNPSVINDPHIRFYAGANLITEDGFSLGTLCVIDRKPRHLTKEESQSLRFLASQVMKLMELRIKSKELTEKSVQLRRKIGDLETLTYTLSHDLKAPLRALEGFSNLLLQKYHDNLDEQGQLWLEFINTNSIKMDYLIKDILVFSKASIAKLNKQPINMTPIVKEIIEMESTKYSGHPLKIDIGELIHGYGDPGGIRQVWSNLISNAFKYSSKKESIEIVIRSENLDDFVQYTIVDNGIGIKPEFKSKLFKVFQRLHEDHDYEGTGVGLAITKKVIDKHNGFISVESNDGIGSKFLFKLPKENFSA